MCSRRSEVVTDEVLLMNDLVERNNKGRLLARPVRQVNDPVTVHFGINLVQILDFDEKNQVITFNVWKQYVSHQVFTFNVWKQYVSHKVLTFNVWKQY
jgi:hypothetical protein